MVSLVMVSLVMVSFTTMKKRGFLPTETETLFSASNVVFQFQYFGSCGFAALTILIQLKSVVVLGNIFLHFTMVSYSFTMVSYSFTMVSYSLTMVSYSFTMVSYSL